MAEFNSPSIWRRSSRCDTDNCVEVAFSTDRRRVYLRNSRDPERHLEISAAAWHTFCSGVTTGELAQETGAG